VHIGQNNMPQGHDPLLDHRGIDARDWLAKLRAAMVVEAQRLPRHQQFIDQHCKAVG
jgi:tryptophan halogenase